MWEGGGMTQCRYRPILFSAPMIRALLAGTKTQTRRVVKFKPWHQIEQRDDGSHWPWMHDSDHDRDYWLPSPYGQPGDRLWVREAFRLCAEADATPPRDTDAAYRVWYEADAPHQPGAGKLRTGMFMPRWASRITLQIAGVRVERLQDISEADAIAEGAPSADLVSGRECIFPHQGLHRWGFQLLWQQINGLDSWDANPWVWVVTFND
jgi:hypothetical protein